MMHRVRMTICMVAAAAVGGCATVPKNAGFRDVQKMVSRRTGLSVQWDRHTIDDQAVANSLTRMLAHRLTVDHAVEIALLNNQNLQATYEDLGVAQADLVQAGLLQNPMLYVERRFPGQAAEVDVVQEFLSVFLIPLRKKIAAADFEAAKARVANAAIDLAAQTRSAFYTLQGDQQMVEMWRSIAKAANAIADVARHIHAAGNSNDLEYDNNLKFKTQAHLELMAAESQVVQDREQLNILMGLWGKQTAWRIAPRLPTPPDIDPPVGGLERLALRKRLDLAADRRQIEAAARSLGMSRSIRYIPALTLSGHYEHEIEGGLHAAGPAVEVGIPLFDQGQAVVARGRSLLVQAQRRYVALGIEIRAKVRAAYNQMTVARSRTQYYKEVVLPLYAKIVQQSQLEYNGMYLGPVQLLLARQEQIDAGREYIDALRDYWLARTKLEEEVGGRIPGLPAPTTRPAAQPVRPRPGMGSMKMPGMNMRGMQMPRNGGGVDQKQQHQH